MNGAYCCVCKKEFVKSMLNKARSGSSRLVFKKSRPGKSNSNCPATRFVCTMVTRI